MTAFLAPTGLSEVTVGFDLLSGGLTVLRLPATFSTMVRLAAICLRHRTGLSPGDLRLHLARTLAPILPPAYHPGGRVPAHLADRVPAVPAPLALIRRRIQPFARALQPAHTPSVSPRQDSAGREQDVVNEFVVHVEPSQRVAEDTAHHRR
jgi:hypothetical protein